MDSHFVYIVCCSDSSLYIGCTNNIEIRINEHNAGEDARYTRTRYLVVLVYQEMHETKLEALRRECEIRTFTR